MGGINLNRKTILTLILGCLVGSAPVFAKENSCEGIAVSDESNRNRAGDAMATLDAALSPLIQAGYGTIAEHLRRALITESPLLISGVKDPVLRQLVDDFFKQAKFLRFHFSRTGTEAEKIQAYDQFIPGLRFRIRTITSDILKTMDPELVQKLDRPKLKFFEDFWTNVIYKITFSTISGAKIINSAGTSYAIALVEGPANLSGLHEFFHDQVYPQSVEALSRAMGRPVGREIAAVNAGNAISLVSIFFQAFAEHLHLPENYKPTPEMSAPLPTVASGTKTFGYPELKDIRQLREQVEISASLERRITEMSARYTELLKDRVDRSLPTARLRRNPKGALVRISKAPVYATEPRKYAARNELLAEEALSYLKGVIVAEFLQPNPRHQNHRVSRALEASDNDLTKLQTLFTQHFPTLDIPTADYDPAAQLDTYEEAIRQSDPALAEALEADAMNYLQATFEALRKSNFFDNVAAVDSMFENNTFKQVLSEGRYGQH